MFKSNRREAFGIACAMLAGGPMAMVALAEEGTEAAGTLSGRGEPGSETLSDLARRAKAISGKAYCPYSKFPVGAVVLTDDGKTFEGCNVENASYGLTICAERNAIFQMVAMGKRPIVAVCIYTPTPKPSAPCGACRQVINEFGPQALILSVCDGPGMLKKKLAELLPDAFGPANLK